MKERKINSSKKTSWTFFLFFNLVLACFLGSLFGFFSSEIRTKLPSLFGKEEKIPTEIIKERIIQEDSAVIQVVSDSSPGVVSIVVKKNVSDIRNFSDPFGDNFFEYFFGTPDPEQNGESKKTIGGGSGFFISNDGMIITNKHVIEDLSAEYSVMTNDGKEFEAKILARDPLNDIAIIKIEGENYPTLNLGDSDQLKIGQTVIAIGNSLGEFSNSVSRGIVSGLKRSVTTEKNFGQSEVLTDIIQTDAAINPGNSGGPLLDAKGDVIGINVAMAQGAENIGFAIPINQVKKAVEQVKNKGEISVPYLGVRYIMIDKSIQKDNNLPHDYGVLVVRGQKLTDLAVIPGSPADKAGIKENDIILEIEDEKINQKQPLVNLISKYSIGQEIKLKIWSKGKEKDIKVILEEKNNNLN